MKLRIFILLIGLLSFSTLNAQKDFGAWTSLNLSLPVTKKLEFSLGIQSRFESNLSSVKKSFVSPEVEYKVAKFLKIGANYRFINYAQDRFFGDEYAHRIGIDATFDVFSKELIGKTADQISKFKISARLRYTHEFEGNDLNDDYLRGLLKIQYELPSNVGLKFHVLGEMFYHFNDQLSYTLTDVMSNNRFNKMRLRAGMDYGFAKRHEVGLFYLVQPQFESTKCKYVLGLSYTYQFKRLNKGKKVK